MPHDSGSSHPLDAAGLLLVRAEEAIALGFRSTPRNARAEIRRLCELAARRERLRPAFEYAPLPDLSDVRRGLARVARESRGYGRLGGLYAARAEELELEARLVETIGRPGFAALAAERFRVPLDEALQKQVATFVEAALGEVVPPRGSVDGAAAPSSNVMSDDLSAPASLVNRVVRLGRELALPIRVEMRPDQLAIAATGHGVVAVRPGVMLSADTAARIALHEIVGHALPRMRSGHAPWTLLRAGTAGSVEAEEGRALLVERRASYLDGARRRELALRHLASLCVRRGADFDDTVRELALRGAERPDAVEIAVRVHRGGGLAREIVYLPAYHEVLRAFDSEPSLERWFERGRVGLEAARMFEALEGREMSPARGSQNPACTV